MTHQRDCTSLILVLLCFTVKIRHLNQIFHKILVQLTSSRTGERTCSILPPLWFPHALALMVVTGQDFWFGSQSNKPLNILPWYHPFFILSSFYISLLVLYHYFKKNISFSIIWRFIYSYLTRVFSLSPIIRCFFYLFTFTFVFISFIKSFHCLLLPSFFLHYIILYFFICTLLQIL